MALAAPVLFCLNAYGEIQDTKDLVRAILENNFDLKISKMSTKEKGTSVESARGDYDINLSLSATRDHSDTPSSSSLDSTGAASSVKSKTDTYSTTLSKKFFFGTELSLPYTYNVVDSTSTSRRVRKTHEPSLGLTMSHPILETFFPDYLEKGIKSAELDREIAKHKHGEKLVKEVDKGLKLFLDCLQEHVTLKVRTLAHKNAIENLEMVSAKRRVGKASLIDKLDASSDERKKFNSKVSTQTKYNTKRGEFELHAFGEKDQGEIDYDDLTSVLEDLPDISKKNDEAILVDKSMSRKEESKRIEKSIRKNKTAFKNAKVDRLPDFDFDASLTYKGLNHKQGRAHDQVWAAKYASWSIGTSLEYSIMGYAANSSKKLNAYKTVQENLKKAKLAGQTRADLKKNHNLLISGEKKIEALGVVVDADKEKYKLLFLKYKNGKATLYELKKALQSREESELQLLKSKVSFLKDFYQFKKSSGQLLEVFFTK